jgi:TetR/AcrR family transcriptional regulator
MKIESIVSVEDRIIEAARKTFIEKGFAQTSMSDIAQAAGINRPTLHYYFRTKDIMFQAVYGGILKSILPKIQVVASTPGLTLEEGLSIIIDAYYDLFVENPSLPLFIMRELDRNADLMTSTLEKAGFMDVLWNLRDMIQEMIARGEIRQVPVRFLLFNFYGLLSVPFLSKNLSRKILEEDENSFRQMLSEWKPVIIRQILSYAGEPPKA